MLQFRDAFLFFSLTYFIPMLPVSLPRIPKGETFCRVNRAAISAMRIIIRTKCSTEQNWPKY